MKLPEDVAAETAAVLAGMGTSFSAAVRMLALQTVCEGAIPFTAGK